jgi:hypothetical protein
VPVGRSWKLVSLRRTDVDARLAGLLDSLLGVTSEAANDREQHLEELTDRCEKVAARRRRLSAAAVAITLLVSYLP